MHRQLSLVLLTASGTTKSAKLTDKIGEIVGRIRRFCHSRSGLLLSVLQSVHAAAEFFGQGFVVGLYLAQRPGDIGTAIA